MPTPSRTTASWAIRRRSRSVSLRSGRECSGRLEATRLDALWVVLPAGQRAAGGLEELASVIGSAASLFGMLGSGKATVILSPFTARRLASEGRTRSDVRSELHARGRLSAETWRRSWIHATVRASDWPDWVH